MNIAKKQRPIKILFVHHGKGIGGASLSLLFLVKGLDRHEFKPVVLFMQNSAAVQMFVREGVEVVGTINKSDFSHTKIWWLRWYHPHHFVRSLFDSGQLLCGLAKKWLEKIKPDIVHLNTSSLFSWAVIAKKMGIPVFWHVREPLAPGYFGLRRGFTRWAVKKWSDVILPICRDNAAPWAELEKTKVVYNAVPEGRFGGLKPKEFSNCCTIDGSPQGSKSFGRAQNPPRPFVMTTRESRSLCKKVKDFSCHCQRPKGCLSPATQDIASCGSSDGPDGATILYLGGLSEEKGTLLLLEAFEKVLEKIPESKLIIAGTWEPKFGVFGGKIPITRWHRFCRRVRQKLEGMKNVQVIGVQRDVVSLMAKSSLVVFPATQGHFARPVIEAGFMGKPTVATNLPPLEELIIDGKTGLLSQPGDVQDLADKLTKVLSNPDLAKTLGQQAELFCRKNFGLTKQVETISSFYRKLFQKV